MQKVNKEERTEIEIVRIDTGQFDVSILGKTPLILHHGSVRPHLLPARKLTRGERETTLKHEPLEEWKDAMMLAPSDAQTRLELRAAAFKGAMMTAALRLPGTVKSEIAQLVWVEGERVPLYGLPRVFIREVRNSDVARTPDARTRPILFPWASRLTISFVKPMVTAQAVANLLAAAGLLAGIGDWRPEKGKGTYGQFDLVDAHDPTFLRVVELGAVAQAAAIREPVGYDVETVEALAWYDDEIARRAVAGQSQRSRRRGARHNEDAIAE